MNLVRVSSPINIAAGLYCSFMHAGHTIGFVAPVDFLAGDEVAVDTASGTPLAVWRNNAVVWRYEPPTVHGTFSGTFDAASLEQFWKAFGAE